MRAFGLIPYPAFISQYYNKLGWCYAQRRTWHGLIYIAMSPPISGDRTGTNEDIYRLRFGAATTVWQGMNSATKDVYNQAAKGKRFSGFNWWVKLYVKNTLVTPSGPSYILLETSDKMLTEASEALIQE